jgi:hypothetical protein
MIIRNLIRTNEHFKINTGWTTKRSKFDSRQDQEFSFLFVIQIGSGIHLASYIIGTGSSFHGNRLDYGRLQWETRPLVREGAPKRQESNFEKKNSGQMSQIWAWHQDILTDWPSVVMWLWLWLSTGVKQQGREADHSTPTSAEVNETTWI